MIELQIKLSENLLETFEIDPNVILIILTSVYIIDICFRFFWSKKILSKIDSKLKRVEQKHSVYNNKQIEALIELHDKTTQLYYSNRILFNPTSPLTDSRFERTLERWAERSLGLHYYYHKNKILFPAKIINLYEDEIENFNKIGVYLKNFLEGKREEERLFHTGNHELYNSYESEIEDIKRQVKIIQDKYPHISKKIHNIRYELQKTFKKVLDKAELS